MAHKFNELKLTMFEISKAWKTNVGHSAMAKDMFGEQIIQSSYKNEALPGCWVIVEDQANGNKVMVVSCKAFKRNK